MERASQIIGKCSYISSKKWERAERTIDRVQAGQRRGDKRAYGNKTQETKQQTIEWISGKCTRSWWSRNLYGGTGGLSFVHRVSRKRWRLTSSHFRNTNNSNCRERERTKKGPIIIKIMRTSILIISIISSDAPNLTLPECADKCKARCYEGGLFSSRSVQKTRGSSDPFPASFLSAKRKDKTKKTILPASRGSLLWNAIVLKQPSLL